MTIDTGGAHMKLARVRWLDSIMASDGWTDMSDLAAQSTPEQLAHSTVGILVIERPELIVVCSSRQDVDERYLGCIAIPRRAIVEMTVEPWPAPPNPYLGGNP